MLNNFDLTIQNLEGLGNISKCNCSIYLDYKEISTQPLNHLPIFIKIPNPGILHLYINDIDSKTQIVSLSFATTLLASDNFYWFPLFLSPKNYLKALPPTINSPKIQIGVNKFQILSNLAENFSPNTETLAFVSNETEKIDYNCLLKKLNQYKKSIKTLKLNLVQSEKILKQKTKYYLSQINQLKSDLESEKNYSLSLEAQLDRAKKLLTNFQNPEDDFSPILKTSPSQFLENTQAKSFHFESFLDSQVNSTLKRFNFQGLFNRCKDLNYRVGSNKTVTLTLKHGKVICHDNISLENYIFHNCKQEIEDLLRQRTRPLSSSPSKSPNKRLCHTPGTKSHKIIRFNI